MIYSIKPIIINIIAISLMVFCTVSEAYDPRYLPEGATVERYSNGRIKRSSWKVHLFKIDHPCVSPCGPGWEVDHPIPLSCGGVDEIWNMQWLDPISKNTKDNYERKIYKAPYVIYGTDNCK
jgi:hypothetical protein